jgi:hypothetical protein
MKKVFLFAALFFLGMTAHAQSASYFKTEKFIEFVQGQNPKTVMQSHTFFKVSPFLFRISAGATPIEVNIRAEIPVAHAEGSGTRYEGSEVFLTFIYDQSGAVKKVIWDTPNWTREYIRSW